MLPEWMVSLISGPYKGTIEHLAGFPKFGHISLNRRRVEAQTVTTTRVDQITERMQNKFLFVTDIGQVGVLYYEDFDTGIRSGGLLVGLFGVNFPFNLRTTNCTDENTTYHIVNNALVSNHQWGHCFLENVLGKKMLPRMQSCRQTLDGRILRSMARRNL